MNKRQYKKDLKFKREIRRFMLELNKNITSLDRSLEGTIKLAASFKEQGLENQYQTALNQIRFSLNTKNKYISLKGDLEMAIQLKDTISVIKGFADSMSKWSKSVSKISKGINIDEVISSVDDASEIINEKSEELDNLTSITRDNFKHITDNENCNYKCNDDVEMLVDNYLLNGKEKHSNNYVTTHGTRSDIDLIRKAMDDNNDEK